MEKELSNLEVAAVVQENNMAEADAIKKYTDLLALAKSSNLSKEVMDLLESTIEEITADELNHQEKLQVLYTVLTDIEPNKD